MNDEEIIELFNERKESALTAVLNKYKRLCYSIAMRIVPNVQDAEECVNDSMLKVWNAIPPERPRSLQAYLSRVVRNCALDRYQYQHADKRNCALEVAFEEIEEFLPDFAGPEEAMENDELKKQLNAFLENQKEEARKFFVRRYWYGESIKEIADAYHVTEEKVRTSLFRTRNRLRDELADGGTIV